MIINDVIENLRDDIAALTWQPAGNTSATSFTEVYTAPVLNGTAGSPWCYINDEASTVVKAFSRGINGDTGYNKSAEIGIYICWQYGEVAAIQESTRRLRDAVEAVEAYIKGAGNLYNAGFTQGWNYRGWDRVDAGELNIEIRRLLIINNYII
jgi:hypothetical protein